jgi:hypothetical protein
MSQLKDSVRPLEKRDEGKGSQMKVINMVVSPRGAARRCQVASRQNELFADEYDAKPAFELFGDCAGVRTFSHRSQSIPCRCHALQVTRKVPSESDEVGALLARISPSDEKIFPLVGAHWG